MNPELDLTLHRVMRAPVDTVWRAWTDPSLLAQWWIPAPTSCRVNRLELRPGGGFVTSMSEDGRDFVPQLDAIFLVIDDHRRIVFTNAITSDWRPAAPAPVPMTAEITFGDHPDGTEYTVVVRHGDPADRDRHEELGFFDGWGSVTAALAALAEQATIADGSVRPEAGAAQ